MRWCLLWWLTAGIAAMCTLLPLLGEGVGASPGPRNEDMFRELLKLDQMYSSIARPSLRSGPSSPEDAMEPKVQRARNMLRLQELDRMYADSSRPRFGKRGARRGLFSNSNFSPNDYEGQYQVEDANNEWMPERR